MNRKTLITGAAGLVLLAAAVTGHAGWYAKNRQVKKLESQLAELQRQEKRSAVLRSVSNQLEEIAFQQKEISDEQREEALLQTKVANEMRERSEVERRNALIAQHQAVASKQKALEAYSLAQSQREIAEHQRIQAELSKRVADTLSYIALGRSLASFATTQFRAGNQEMADLLCYAASLYTNRYNGDIYYPTIYQALTICGQNQNQWSKHEGSVKELEFVPNSDKELISVSTYGEILRHVRDDRQLNTTILLKDNRYDFRDLYIDKKTKTIYAVSRTGELAIKSANNLKILPLTGIVHPLNIEPMQDTRYLLIVGENSLARLDLKTNTVTATRKLDFNVTLCGRYDYAPMIFDDKGRMHVVRDITELETRKVPIVGRVTAFASSKNTGYEAYGLDNGTIFLLDKNKTIRRLVGHRSRISKIKINGHRLYSSSYDGTVNLWVTNSDKIEPMTLLNTGSWVMSFVFDPSKNYIWTGTQNGYLSEVLFSVQKMSEGCRNRIKRNLTEEEWNYYIGRNVPYEPFLSQRRKEAGS